MMNFGDYQKWLAKVMKDKPPVNESQFNFERGDVVSFLHSPKRGSGAKQNDMFVLMMAVEMRSEGQGRGVWGYNLYETPLARNRNHIAEHILSQTIDNMELLGALYQSYSARRGFKLYTLDGIRSPVMKLTDKQLEEILK